MRLDLVFWDDERIAKLKELWDAGAAAQAIGRQLGTSKNAVVGKAHRLDLPRRPSPIRRGVAPREPRQKRAAKVLALPAPPQAAIAESMPPAAAVEPAPALAPVVLPPLPAKHRSQKDREVPPQRLAAPGPRRANGCQWIEGEPSWDDACKCGADVLLGQPYCAAHFVRSRKGGEHG